MMLFPGMEIPQGAPRPPCLFSRLYIILIKNPQNERVWCCALKMCDNFAEWLSSVAANPRGKAMESGNRSARSRTTKTNGAGTCREGGIGARPLQLPSMHLDDILTTVRGDPIRVADVVTLLKIRRFFRSAIYELIERRVVFAHAERLELAPLPLPRPPCIPYATGCGGALALRIPLCSNRSCATMALRLNSGTISPAGKS